ncbi:cysteine protease StiP family protein [Paenibacillus taiwanensis]|uniref:cysteine protease StiP family protein n=1 Tax=Paenibacillus taiwanensis TaxID=401638 RepID=UPI0004061067|nr:cysteine protease StiP family protein [Paenibacillus taiwanensis]
MLTNLMSRRLPEPPHMGSYRAEDVRFVLKDLSGLMMEQGTEDREEAIQAGVHYSEMLPLEYRPSDAYIQLFHQALTDNAERVALAVGIVAELIRLKRGDNVVLASLARAGTPVGILIKRYWREICQLEAPHYSISIIRGKGIDENAVCYMLQQHPDRQIQFVDGWTGKGAIRTVLMQASDHMFSKYGVQVDDDLAVLADPGRCSDTYGTREDYLIPSACLNSTVSGLISRTVHRADLIGADDYHGAKFYREWQQEDLSNLFVDTVSGCFARIAAEAKVKAAYAYAHPREHRATWRGLEDVVGIQDRFGIHNVNLIKPGVGETTRVLLRRVPWKIIVDRLDNPSLKHILLLAEQRNVPVEVYKGLSYSCCGLIKSMKEDA